MMKLSPKDALKHLHTDITQLLEEWPTIAGNLEDQLGGWPSTASGGGHIPEGSNEQDPVYLTGVERAALHDGLGRSHAIYRLAVGSLNHAATLVDILMRLTRDFAAKPTSTTQWGHCAVHTKGGYPTVPAPHYSRVGSRLPRETRLCDRCYRRISEKGAVPSKADIRSLETKGHWPARPASMG